MYLPSRKNVDTGWIGKMFINNIKNGLQLSVFLGYPDRMYIN